MLLWDRRFHFYVTFSINIRQQVVNSILVLSLYDCDPILYMKICYDVTI